MNEKALFERLDRHNDIMQQILESMPQPASKFTSVLETVALIAGAFSFISIADTIVKWIRGG